MSPVANSASVAAVNANPVTSHSCDSLAATWRSNERDTTEAPRTETSSAGAPGGSSTRYASTWGREMCPPPEDLRSTPPSVPGPSTTMGKDNCSGSTTVPVTCRSSPSASSRSVSPTASPRSSASLGGIAASPGARGARPSRTENIGATGGRSIGTEGSRKKSCR